MCPSRFSLCVLVCPYGLGRRFSRRKIVVHHDTAWWPMRFRIPAYVHGVVPTSNVCTPNAGTTPYAFEPSPDK